MPPINFGLPNGRCECHDCTQARSHPFVFYDPAVVDLAGIAIPVKPPLTRERLAAVHKAAIDTERSRCAKIADDLKTNVGGVDGGQGMAGWDQACDEIAARIRSGECQKP